MAIHACRGLATQIVKVFKKYAPQNAHLIIVPCCLFKNHELQKSVGYDRWKLIRQQRQLRDENTGRPTDSNWRIKTAMQARNEILANEHETAFRSAVVVPEILSLHNVALHFENNINLDLNVNICVECESQ